MGGRISPIVLEAWTLDRKWILDYLGIEGRLLLEARVCFHGSRASDDAGDPLSQWCFDGWDSFFWGLALDRVMWGPDQT